MFHLNQKVTSQYKDTFMKHKNSSKLESWAEKVALKFCMGATAHVLQSL